MELKGDGGTGEEEPGARDKHSNWDVGAERWPAVKTPGDPWHLQPAETRPAAARGVEWEGTNRVQVEQRRGFAEKN